eukprot:TRINITY_DN6712_c0_g1_i1.p1 TRINITY_DN6712_c0_g1~~TRINITY_DN6712_c0_g1_i1.p1  ORF type:complete len:862 (+),score=146.20 TRINITY_DN6712_c0_g1_i1:93-2678(+)
MLCEDTGEELVYDSALYELLETRGAFGYTTPNQPAASGVGTCCSGSFVKAEVGGWSPFGDPGGPPIGGGMPPGASLLMADLLRNATHSERGRNAPARGDLFGSIQSEVAASPLAEAAAPTALGVGTPPRPAVAKRQPAKYAPQRAAAARQAAASAAATAVSLPVVATPAPPAAPVSPSEPPTAAAPAVAAAEVEDMAEFADLADDLDEIDLSKPLPSEIAVRQIIESFERSLDPVIAERLRANRESNVASESWSAKPKLVEAAIQTATTERTPEIYMSHTSMATTAPIVATTAAKRSATMAELTDGQTNGRLYDFDPSLYPKAPHTLYVKGFGPNLTSQPLRNVVTTTANDGSGLTTTTTTFRTADGARVQLTEQRVQEQVERLQQRIAELHARLTAPAPYLGLLAKLDLPRRGVTIPPLTRAELDQYARSQGYASLEAIPKEKLFSFPPTVLRLRAEAARSAASAVAVMVAAAVALHFDKDDSETRTEIPAAEEEKELGGESARPEGRRSPQLDQHTDPGPEPDSNQELKPAKKEDMQPAAEDAPAKAKETPEPVAQDTKSSNANIAGSTSGGGGGGKKKKRHRKGGKDEPPAVSEDALLERAIRANEELLSRGGAVAATPTRRAAAVVAPVASGTTTGATAAARGTPGLRLRQLVDPPTLRLLVDHPKRCPTTHDERGFCAACCHNAVLRKAWRRLLYHGSEVTAAVEGLLLSSGSPAGAKQLAATLLQFDKLAVDDALLLFQPAGSEAMLAETERLITKGGNERPAVFASVAERSSPQVLKKLASFVGAGLISDVRVELRDSYPAAADALFHALSRCSWRRVTLDDGRVTLTTATPDWQAQWHAVRPRTIDIVLDPEA